MGDKQGFLLTLVHAANTIYEKHVSSPMGIHTDEEGRVRIPPLPEEYWSVLEERVTRMLRTDHVYPLIQEVAPVLERLPHPKEKTFTAHLKDLTLLERIEAYTTAWPFLKKKPHYPYFTDTNLAPADYAIIEASHAEPEDCWTLEYHLRSIFSLPQAWWRRKYSEEVNLRMNLPLRLDHLSTQLRRTTNFLSRIRDGERKNTSSDGIILADAACRLADAYTALGGIRRVYEVARHAQSFPGVVKYADILVKASEETASLLEEAYDHMLPYLQQETNWWRQHIVGRGYQGWETARIRRAQTLLDRARRYAHRALPMIFSLDSSEAQMAGTGLQEPAWIYEEGVVIG